jgi:hypothetical protein
MELSSQTIKKIVKEELPGLMKRDREIRQIILELSKEPLTEIKEQMDKIEIETESRFDRLLDELRKDREEQSKKWEEQNKKWEEQNKKWEENQEDIKKLYITINRKHDSTLGALGSRWGLRTEASFRNALKDILKDFNVKVLNVKEYDEEGEVFGRPEDIELDIIILNGKLIISEIKSSMSRADMYEFYKKAKLYEKLHQRKADRWVVISPMVDEKARSVAEELKIKIYSYADDMGEDIAGER